MQVTIHVNATVHIHCHQGEAELAYVAARIRNVAMKLGGIMDGAKTQSATEGVSMSKIDDVNAALAQVDAQTDTLAAFVQGLEDQINATPGDGLTAEQTDAVLASLAHIRGRLEGIGQNPQNPFPAPPPAPSPVQ